MYVYAIWVFQLIFWWCQKGVRREEGGVGGREGPPPQWEDNRRAARTENTSPTPGDPKGVGGLAELCTKLCKSREMQFNI